MDFPISKVKIDLTSLCNLSCEFCPYHGLDGEISRGSSLDKNLVFNLIDDLKKLDQKPVIRFAGTGESLCHPNFKEISEYLISNNQRVRLITNGTRINDYLSLLSASLERLVVSVHGDELIHDSLTRVSGSFEKAISGIKNLKVLNPTLDIVLHMALTPKNYHQIIDHAILAKSLDVMPRYQHFRMTPANLKMGRIKPSKLSSLFNDLIANDVVFSTIPKIHLADFENYYDESISFLKNKSQCTPLIDDVHVRYDGDVYICDSVKIGSLKKDAIYDIINSSKRESHITSILSQIKYSGSLPSTLCNRCRFH